MNDKKERKRHFTGGAEKRRIKQKKLMSEQSGKNHKLFSFFQSKNKNIVDASVEVQIDGQGLFY